MIRCALVTGGAGGLGRALAALLLERGAHVILADSSADALEFARARLGKDAALDYCVLDVSEGRDWAILARRLQGEGRTVDMLINNACIPSARESLLDISPEQWRAMLDVGLTGAFLGISTFMPAMVAQGCGHILNIASMAAFGPSPLHGDYAAAKAGLVSLSETLRDELCDTGVHVSVACPGAIGRAVGHKPAEGEAAAAAGRMDPVAGMRHVLDAALAGQFFVITHGEGAKLAANRARALQDAFAQAPC